MAMETTNQAARRRLLRLATLGVLAAAGLAGTLHAYLPLLDNYFVADDYNYLRVGHAVLQSPAILFDQHALWELYAGAVLRPVGNLLWAALVLVFDHHAAAYYALMIAVHLLNTLLLAVVFRAWLRDSIVAVLAAALFATAYGLRNGVCWIANLNETLILPLELALIVILHRWRDRRWCRPVVGLLVAVGCLLKESVAPILLVLLADDWLVTNAPGVKRFTKRWALGLACVAAYLALRFNPAFDAIYAGAGAGAHSLASYPALVESAFGSNLLPVYFIRALQAPELVPLIGWTVVVVLLWLAVRGRGPARLLALWVLVQPLPYSLVPATTPGALQSHYLYCATAPAMGLVALGLVNLFRASRPRPLLYVPALLWCGFLLWWTNYGIARNRMDEATHWEVASQTLRRDFAFFDAQRFLPGTHVYLVITPDQTPGGGAWWGWGGYPVISAMPVDFTRLNSLDELPPLTPPYAVFTYLKDVGPQLATRVDAAP